MRQEAEQTRAVLAGQRGQPKVGAESRRPAACACRGDLQVALLGAHMAGDKVPEETQVALQSTPAVHMTSSSMAGRLWEALAMRCIKSCEYLFRL